MFGTDGVRGRVGVSPMTAEQVLKLGWAAGQVLNPDGGGRVLIGKDTRISGYMFESVLEAGLVASGVNISLLGPMPTPAVAYLTQAFRASAGIMISASHNPYYDNGVKFFGPKGNKLSVETEQAIVAKMAEPLTTVESNLLGKADRVGDAQGRYIEFCKSTFPSHLSLKGLSIVVDCAHGSAYHIAPYVFSELGAEVLEVIGAEPDGLNINLECGATHLAPLKAAVKANKADLGIALDGDGDRVQMVLPDGREVDGDDMLYVIACARQRDETLIGPVVGTVMSNFGVEQALQAKGIQFRRADVGDRHVFEMLDEFGGVIGGEPSGHVVCFDQTTTGDGVVTALQVLAAIVDSETTLSALLQDYQKAPQVLINVDVRDKTKAMQAEAVLAAVTSGEAALKNTGRILLRPSGTEPKVRVMVEGQHAQLVQQLAEDIAGAVKDSRA